MSKEFSFSVMPSVSISRSRFVRKSQHKTTFNLGQLIPVYCDEVLPGDTRSIDIASLVRMSTPIAPIMDNIYLDVFAFFVPNRIVWDHWKEFMGENNTSAGIPSVSYGIPRVFGSSSAAAQSCSYADYLGLPVGINDVVKTCSALPFRGIAKIYNRWFRDENIIAPLAIQTGDNNEVLVGSSNFAISSSSILLVSKIPDYFTTALPYAQKGAAVNLPLGSFAPVGLKSNDTVSQTITTSPYQFTDGTGSLGAGEFKQYNSGATGGTSLPTWVADLSSATAATINQIRYAFQLQKFLEKDCMGTRYWEILANHFGVEAPDASLQDPEYLGGTRININIDQVLSTAAGTNGAGTPSTSILGQPGANSVTAHKGSLFTKSFVEHGYLFIFVCARHDSTYSQGINRMWTRKTRYDFYWPVFANLGAQEVKNKEIYAQGNSSDDGTFGYQFAWNEYRYKPSLCSGLLRPNVTGNLGFWTLSENFSALPTLSASFMEQGRGNLARALTTGATGPDFVADFYFRDIAVRPMPVYSIPGLVDHH